MKFKKFKRAKKVKFLCLSSYLVLAQFSHFFPSPSAFGMEPTTLYWCNMEIRLHEPFDHRVRVRVEERLTEFEFEQKLYGDKRR
jgi:hypothetical protein